jgi:metal-responsive CopG/Arc/MetJ family transcriptional regulator
MGKPLGKLVGTYLLKPVIDRIDVAVIETNSKSRSELIAHILISWLDSQGF